MQHVACLERERELLDDDLLRLPRLRLRLRLFPALLEMNNSINKKSEIPIVSQLVLRCRSVPLKGQRPVNFNHRCYS
jgi:hypothetical protein